MTDPSPPSAAPGSDTAADSRRLRWPDHDLIFGIFLPVACVLADLLLRGFRSGSYLPGSVLAGIVSMAAVLSFWRTLGRRHPRWGGLAGGILLIGSAGSLLLGSCLLPVILGSLFLMPWVFWNFLIHDPGVLTENPGTLLTIPWILVFGLTSLLGARIYYRRGFEAVRAWTSWRDRDGSIP